MRRASRNPVEPSGDGHLSAARHWARIPLKVQPLAAAMSRACFALAAVARAVAAQSEESVIRAAEDDASAVYRFLAVMLCIGGAALVRGGVLPPRRLGAWERLLDARR